MQSMRPKAEARSSFAAAGCADRLHIEICDEGCGIPSEQEEKIFDPFFTTKESGTGLGLAIAANIVEQHGGLLTTFHNLDKGMTFRIDLPLERPLKPGETSDLR